MIRIVIADDQPMFCEMLAQSLDANPSFEVLATVSNGVEALSQCESEKPDIVVMDLKMDVCDSIEATRRIKAQFPEIKLLILTACDQPDSIINAVGAGIDGYMVKNTNIDNLHRAIIDIYKGLKVFDESALDAIVQNLGHNHYHPATGTNHHASSLPFSEGELEILTLIAAGSTTAQIAKQLHLSTGTVYNYISMMMARLGLKDRVQLVAWALRQRIIA